MKSFALISLLFSSIAFASPTTSHVQFVATYLQPGTTHPTKNYLPEFINNLSAVHLGPEYFGTVRSTLGPRQAIIDLADEFFDYTPEHRGQLLANYQSNLDKLVQNYLVGYEDKILAFYIADEPSDYGITRESRDTVIAAVKKIYPNIPTYIIWDQDCFDNTPALDKKCGLAGHRGIPAAVDWVGFDWYLRGKPEADAADFKAHTVAAVERMKSITNKGIVLIPDGTDEFLKDYLQDTRDQIMAQRMQLFLDYADSESQIIGIDNYAWGTHDEVLRGVDTHVIGTTEFPLTKKVLFDYAAIVRALNP